MSDDPNVNRTKLFTIVFILLVILTGISFGVANSSIMDEPVKGWLAMMIISVAKALLVIVFFMHLKWETNWKWVLTIPAAVMSTLLVLILIPDIGNRTDSYSAERQKFAAYELQIDGFKRPEIDPGLLSKPANKQEEKSDDNQPDDDTNQANSTKDYSDVPGDWGTLKGKFIFVGDVPSRTELFPDKDKTECELPMYSRELLVGSNGSLENVVVYLNMPKEPLPIHPYYEDQFSTPIELDNKLCRFEPHIILLNTRQQLRVKNSDSVGHNANITAFKDPNCSNNSVAAGQHLDLTLPEPESRPFVVACSSHQWMKGYILLRDEPYMAVSNKSGEFEIQYFPAGKWKLRFWQEKAGYLRDCTAGGKKITDNKGFVEVEIPKDGVLDLGEIKVDAQYFSAK